MVALRFILPYIFLFTSIT